MNAPRLLLLGVASTLMLGPACSHGGGGGGGSSASGTSTAYLMVGDAPADELSSFEITITGITFLRANGSETANLLPAPRRVDLIELSTESALVEVRDVAAETILGVRMVFDPGSIVARGLGGDVVPVAAVGNATVAFLREPHDVVRDTTLFLHMDVPLDHALANDPATPGGLLFTPLLVVTLRDGERIPMRERSGTVTEVLQIDHAFRLKLTEAEDGSEHGEILVRVNLATIFLDGSGNRFVNEAAFFGALTVGDRVSAAGTLESDGSFSAARVRIDRQDDVARIAGTVSAFDTATDRLTLQIRTIEWGRLVVDPVLGALANPPEIEVDYTLASFQLLGDDPGSSDETELDVGQSIVVDFSGFSTPPFPAHQVFLQHPEGEFGGTIVDTSGLPNSFLVHFDAEDPAVRGGLVTSETTDVLVVLDGSEEIFLKLEGEDALIATDLLPDLRARVRGDLSGLPDSPQLDAVSVRVDPGRMHGVVTATDFVGGTFEIDIDSISDPFGGAALTDPVTIRFDDQARVTGDVENTTEFFELFASLPPGTVMLVEIEGLADGLGGAIAWRAGVETQTP